MPRQAPLRRWRRPPSGAATPGPQDVQIEMLYCGVCHSDLHQVRNEWQHAMPTVYPCVPGHEIVGRVVKAGSAVRKFKEGDLAAVGCMVDSCRTCSELPGRRRSSSARARRPSPTTLPDKHLGGVTYGGYSESIVVDEAFVLRVPDELDPAGAAPLLCAGITTYSPLRHWKVGKGQKVGVVGLGGLGHMAVKFASAFGARVVLFTTSPNKAADALRLGAHEVVVSKNAAEMQKHLGQLRLHPGHGLRRARPERLPRPAEAGRHADPGRRAGEARCPLAAFSLLFGRRRLAGLGHRRHPGDPGDAGLLRASTASRPTSSVFPIQKINEAYERLLKSDVKYRFVIDMASLKP